jgi:hypothetical protein
MRDFDADNFIRPGYGNIDPIVQAWMVGITGGIIVAVIVSTVVYWDYQTVPQLPSITASTGIFEMQLPVMPAPPDSPKQ